MNGLEASAIVVLICLAACYQAGKVRGKKAGLEEGKLTAIIEQKSEVYTTGVCPLCGRVSRFDCDRSDRMAGLNFVKIACGDLDFAVVEPSMEDVVLSPSDWSAVAALMCSRTCGIGVSGLVLILPSDTADYRLQVFDSNGKEIRPGYEVLVCSAAYVLERDGLSSAQGLALETSFAVATTESRMTDGAATVFYGYYPLGDHVGGKSCAV